MDTLEQQIVDRVKAGNLVVPVYPPVAAKLARLLSSPDYALDEVAELLKTDGSLTAIVLQLANSAYYSRGQPVTTLSAAVLRLGAKELQRHVLAAGLQKSFAQTGPLAALRRRAWRNALASAAICELLGKAEGGKGEEDFICGLLHDIGRVLALKLLEDVLAQQKAAGATATQLTRSQDEWWALIDRFHVELGMVMAAKWELPPAVEAVVRDHETMTEDSPALAKVRAADVVVDLLEVQPRVTEQMLVGTGRLSAAHAAVVAKGLPELPGLLDAFAIPSTAPETPGGLTVVKLNEAARLNGPGRKVELTGIGPAKQPGELVEVGPLEFRVMADLPARVNQVVRVKIDDQLALSANVLACEMKGRKFEWSLRPYALSEKSAQLWERFHHGVAKEAAAPVYKEKALHLRTVLI